MTEQPWGVETEFKSHLRLCFVSVCLCWGTDTHTWRSGQHLGQRSMCSSRTNVCWPHGVTLSEALYPNVNWSQLWGWNSGLTQFLYFISCSRMDPHSQGVRVTVCKHTFKSSDESDEDEVSPLRSHSHQAGFVCLWWGCLRHSAGSKPSTRTI